MSKDFPQFSEEETVKPTASAKSKRTGGAVRGRKPVSEKKSKEAGREEKGVVVVKAPVAEAKVAEVKVAEAKVPEARVARPEKSVREGEAKWEEAAPESVGGGAPGGEGGNKRKRRRRKGKGGGASAVVESATEPVGATAPTAPASPQPVKSRLDPEALAKAAWKIYLAEVSEEGVALIGDQDARELARRCFRLAEIFLEERGRR